MSIKKVIKTVGGEFRQDESGLYHYKNISHNHVFDALKDAIKNRPGVTWFWFNETPAPIFLKDTPKVLLARWEAWRKAYQSDRGGLVIGTSHFLSVLLKMSRAYN
ncbi:MAG: hypothetical protein A3I26_03810 [Candidatus Yanofskybacteria bacterium RIFCSPLOWO2_02_FULL_43_10]|uniref:Uncharacterized protein n=2 Tax=Parcubacteria group TaxID=1794811 RepID=A0A1G2RRZ7_9BACT|nr:MAG: hypothetical protein A2742_01940 [Candidatus Yanofskybacteria bacterium RIFCSPHIGHO2_01_FULL_43_32]OGN10742.1 MAG: hypothetical protein A3C69_03935 [Candidatus Yanofskybacteria bacterium RIFCSPHIGHO2_02_FULL_43_12]OGN17352.1 MAG: hypothetical protein A3E34_00510 [Candidatus Yanofskybacteria bacterium RIFCSPHIGHO2_12_FULL_43_11]OGN29907.1 MAG: hypothetical protein A3I26_03810 [Candidatus Yanofskybacteria bacterium RIFCSPLOWO2_02_FULL_43_10]OGN34384.1 MAG: hypothetical protein A3G51_03275